MTTKLTTHQKSNLRVRVRDEHGFLTHVSCNKCQDVLPLDSFSRNRNNKRDGVAITCKMCATKIWHERASQNRIRFIKNRIKSKCKKEGIPFDLDESDIVIPAVCPILGIPIKFGRALGETRDNSPSIDRIDPTAGYVKNNIIVVSFRANRIKNDSFPDEMIAIATFYKNLIKERDIVLTVVEKQHSTDDNDEYVNRLLNTKEV